MEETTCPDSGESMEVGYIPDAVRFGAIAQSEWVPGVAARGMFGLIADFTGYKRRLPIVTYRCEQCGLLKSYARSGRKT